MTPFKKYLIQFWYPQERTDKELADRLEVDKALVCRWLSGKAEPSLERILQIARVLNTDSRLVFPDSRKDK